MTLQEAGNETISAVIAKYGREKIEENQELVHDVAFATAVKQLDEVRARLQEMADDIEEEVEAVKQRELDDLDIGGEE